MYLKLYKDAVAPEVKLENMMKAHDHIWPYMVLTNNYWQEEMFRAHCEGWTHVILAAGAGVGKSMTVAKIALLWWLASPKKRSAVISSTTLDSLESRIWGYVVKLVENTQVPLPCQVLGGKPPKVIYPGSKDKIHGMFATAIREGDTERTLSTLIGRHPDDGLMLVLDECTDISTNLVKALPNLEQGTPFFQLFGIGNSSDKNDLHGALATPQDGWESVSPETHKKWRTTHKNGICLYFSPYDSPAIRETDPIKKAALSKFLITEEGIAEKIQTYGVDSDAFYRFVLGFWRPKSLEKVILSPQFIEESKVTHRAEWSGLYPLTVVAGLDPAVSTGSKGCVLRFALIGHTTNGQMVIDFMYDQLMHYIVIHQGAESSAELQIAEQVNHYMNKYNCSLNYLALDATGIGRALGELLKLKMRTEYTPLKIVSTNGSIIKNKDDTLVYLPPIEMWVLLRKFIQHKQVRGLDDKTISQIVNRRILEKGNKEVLEYKADYINRMAAISPKNAHSPNEADSAILCVMAALYRAGLTPGATRPIHSGGLRWQEKYRVFISNQASRQNDSTSMQPALEASFTSSTEDVVWVKN